MCRKPPLNGAFSAATIALAPKHSMPSRDGNNVHGITTLAPNFSMHLRGAFGDRWVSLGIHLLNHEASDRLKPSSINQSFIPENKDVPLLSAHLQRWVDIDGTYLSIFYIHCNSTGVDIRRIGPRSAHNSSLAIGPWEIPPKTTSAV